LKNLLGVFVMFIVVSSKAQIAFSFASDLSVMRNFSPEQKFWSLGQTVQFNFHFNQKQSAYAWLSYYTPGKFSNSFSATAKSIASVPSAISFRATEKWRNSEVSLGWKHYFKGGFETETSYGLYTIAGFGLMFSKIENVFNRSIDTSLYNTPTLPGNSKFYRLTLDIGAGVEYPVGGSFFVYSDVRAWIPTSDYPSPYLHKNKNVPLPFMVSLGMRILFDY
jgi:hypothetical protein